MSLPIIAIVGRPNTGKSTLFNRLIGKRAAVTSPTSGTTRDRVYHEAKMGNYQVILVDTGGLVFGAEKFGSEKREKSIENDVQLQARIAILEAHAIIFVLDATEPLTANDIDCAQFLRRSKKPVVLVANKSESKKIEKTLPEFFELGLGEPLQVSAIQNYGIIELENTVQKLLKKMKWLREKPHIKNKIHVAIVGKPNVGKSSLVNALLGKEHLIVSDKPGTTIDAIDTPFHFRGDDFVLIDTAGLRRRGKQKQDIEKYSVLRSLQSISRSDVTCLVLDVGTGIANQDLHVCEYILDAAKGLIIAVNKTDLMEDRAKDEKKFLADLQYRMSFAPWAPCIFISALEKKNIFKIFELAKNIAAERKKRISDKDFALFLKTTIAVHPAARAGHKIIIKNGAQTGICPPEFTIYANRPDLIHFSYQRFLENEIRRHFGFYGTAIKIQFKE